MGKFAAKQMPKWYLREVLKNKPVCAGCAKKLPVDFHGNHYTTEQWGDRVVYNLDSYCTNPKR